MMRRIYFSFFIIVAYIFTLNGQSNFPQWAKGIVWYQIFPERFANSDTANDPAADKVFANSNYIPKDWHISKWTSNWYAQTDWKKNSRGDFQNHLYQRRYGGDIQGIIDHLDYLNNLGIGAIYLNPIFEAVSLHKYDGSTYHHIDVNFGPDPEGDRKLIASEIPDKPSTWKWTSADKLFLKLIDEVHKRGMKIIIDGVFNHTGIQFWAFQDILKNGENSKYKNWYEIEEFDDTTTAENEFEYKGWANVKSLPEFNRTDEDLNPGPKQYIMHSTERWMDPDGNGEHDDGIDGWRLDVAREVPLGFWQDWSKLVKSINPEAIVIGELWELSPDFISEGKPFDALMNYNFAFAVQKFFVNQKEKISATDFIEKLKEINETYPEKNLDLLQNLLDSHDTERIVSLIENPDRVYDRGANTSNSDYNPGKPSAESYKRLKLIVAFQMLYKGAPMIYYGDEVGMWGADDPHDRQPMVWDNLKYNDQIITESSGFSKGLGIYKVKQDKELLHYYKKMISFRNKNKAIREGDIKFLYANDAKSTFVFSRTKDDNIIIAVFNTGEGYDSFDIPVEEDNILYEELFSGEKGSIKSTEETTSKLRVYIPSGSVKVYRVYVPK